jgi:dihydroxyacetone kinase-like predicted kinase
MSSNIFGGGAEKAQTEFKEKVDTHSKALITVVERQKDIESSLDLLNEKLELVDHNSIKNFKKLFNDQKTIRSDMRDLKVELENLKDYSGKITKQLRLMTTKDEVTKLEKYIDLWNPMEFVTRDELKDHQKKTVDQLKKIIQEFLKE